MIRFVSEKSDIIRRNKLQKGAYLAYPLQRPRTWWEIRIATLKGEGKCRNAKRLEPEPIQGGGSTSALSLRLRQGVLPGGCLRRHRALQVFVDLVEEAFGRQPLLVGADEECEIFRHVPSLDRVDADFFQRRGEAR